MSYVGNALLTIYAGSYAIVTALFLCRWRTSVVLAVLTVVGAACIFLLGRCGP